MDHKFDAVVKAMAMGQTRPEALRWLGGIFGGMVLGTPLITHANQRPSHGTPPSGGGGSGTGSVNQACRGYCSMIAPGSNFQNCMTACQLYNGNTKKVCGTCGAMYCTNTSTDINN